MAETKGPITFKLKFKQTTQEATIADHRDSPDGLHLTLIKSLNSLFPNSAKYTPGAISFFKKDSVCYRIDDFSEISENCVIKARIDPERVPLGYCISIDDKPVKVDAPSDFKNTVSLRGLPWESTEEDIRVFFSGLEISGVYINYAGAHTSKHSGGTL